MWGGLPWHTFSGKKFAIILQQAVQINLKAEALRRERYLGMKGEMSLAHPLTIDIAPLFLSFQNVQLSHAPHSSAHSLVPLITSRLKPK